MLISRALAAAGLVLLAGCATAPARLPADALARNPALQANLYVYGSAEYGVITQSLYHEAAAAVRARADALRRNQPVRQAVHAAADPAEFPLCSPRQRQRPAVVLDIDETVLLNVGYQGFALRNGGFTPETWAAWEAAGSPSARPVPGVEAFLAGLIAQGIEPVFLSNRAQAHGEATRTALIEILQWSQASYAPRERIVPGDTLLLRTTTPDKTERRTTAARDRCVLALVGDQLGDFTSAIDQGADGQPASPEARIAASNRFSEQWQRQWFLLPNPAYGRWSEGLAADRTLGDWTPPRTEPDIKPRASH